MQAAPGILHMALCGLPDSAMCNGKLLPAAVSLLVLTLQKLRRGQLVKPIIA